MSWKKMQKVIKTEFCEFCNKNFHDKKKLCKHYLVCFQKNNDEL